MIDMKKRLVVGSKGERDAKPWIEQVFGEVEFSDDNYANFDFHSRDNKVFVEHKERFCRYGQYDGLYFDKIKYTKFLELKKTDSSVRCFIVWTCRNGRYVWEFQESDTLEDNNTIVWEPYFQRNFDRGQGRLQDTDLINVLNEYIKPLTGYQL